MSLNIEYIFGSIKNVEIFDSITDDDFDMSDEIKELIESIYDDNKKQIIEKEQNKLDSLVRNYISKFDRDYCDYTTFNAIEVEDKIYINI
jgi:hypothetical protein